MKLLGAARGAKDAVRMGRSRSKNPRAKQRPGIQRLSARSLLTQISTLNSWLGPQRLGLGLETEGRLGDPGEPGTGKAKGG